MQKKAGKPCIKHHATPKISMVQHTTVESTTNIRAHAVCDGFPTIFLIVVARRLATDHDDRAQMSLAGGKQPGFPSATVDKLGNLHVRQPVRAFEPVAITT